MTNTIRKLTEYLVSTVLVAIAAPAIAATIDCGKPPAGSIEVLVCEDAGLMAMDRVMATVYADALRVAANEHPPRLKAEQRGWIKGRNECWKSDQKRACVVESYRRRIASLQASYRLIPASAPVRFVCNGDPRDEVIAIYFQTDPPSLIAERGDSVSLMFLEPDGPGAKYVGRNEWLWQQGTQARLRWGYEAPEMACTGDRPAEPEKRSLAGTHWKLSALQSMDDAQGMTRIPASQTYRLSFAAEGRAVLQLDCNRGFGSWSAEAVSDASGHLTFGPVAMTRALCPNQSLDRKIAARLNEVRSYLLKNDRLYLSLIADGGVLEWIEER